MSISIVEVKATDVRKGDILHMDTKNLGEVIKIIPGISPFNQELVYLRIYTNKGQLIPYVLSPDMTVCVVR